MISLSDIVRPLSNLLDRPLIILLIIPLLLLLFFLVKKDFVKLKEDSETISRKKSARKWVLFLRSIFIILLVIAIAGPHITSEKTIHGDAYIQLLVDDSKSMEMFSNPAAELKEKLEKKISVEEKHICLDENSNIGDEILNSLQPGGSVLLVSDGNANIGANLGDVALYASKLNTSINAIKLKEIKSDAGVMILGPSKTMQGVDNSFKVLINKAGNIKKVKLTVTIDGETVYDQETTDPLIEFDKEFSGGDHKMIAKISSDTDYFKDNNIFYKSIRVVPQPKILFLSEKTSPLKTLLDEIFIVDQKSSIPSDIDDYYAVVVNDMPADRMDPLTDVLNDFVSEGNGLLVVGGENSFEEGNYKNGLFETILPVFVGSPGKKEGDINVALVIDISGSTGSAYGDNKAVDVEKALAISAYQDLSLNTRLAVIVFNTEAKLISEPSYVFEKVGLDDTIASLKDGGGTMVSAGIMKAIQVLGSLAGSKNIILISDGKTQAESASVEAARYANKLGFKIYTVGVGASTNEPLMMNYAEITNGIYFKADQESRLKLIFGDAEDKDESGGKMGFTILDSNHFITQNLEITANIHGFNTVFPKSTSRMLATTSTGEPILVISRLGLGRVASLAIDDGSQWSGELLNKQNSKIMSRIMNWVIGDPERKSSSFVEAKDTRINEPTEILVKSDVPPSSENVNFYKIDEDTFSASITPTTLGFQSIAGAQFATNYPSEYSQTGLSDELNLVVGSTGGRIYSEKDIDKIVENAKTKSKRTIVTKVPLLWPFLGGALLIYLLEIFIRRIFRRE